MKKILTSLLAILIFVLLQAPMQSMAEDGLTFDENGIRTTLMKTNSLQITETFAKNDNWMTFETRKNVSLNKEWTINFSDIATHEKIDAIVIERNSQFIPVTITLNNEKLAKVKATTEFAGSADYTLKVLLSNGKKYKIDFTTVSEPRFLDIEPNNLYTQAQEVYLSETISGEISKNDVDFYRIEVPYYGELSIDLKGFNGAGLSIWIFGENGDNKESISYNNNITQGTLTSGLMPGTYYIKVSGYSSRDTSKYELTTNFQKSKYESFEGSYNYLDAPLVNLNESFVGHIGYLVEEKRGKYYNYFKVEVTEIGTLSIDLTAYNQTGLDIRLYGPNGDNELPIEYKKNITQGKVSAGLNPGTYYIKVSPHYNGYTPFKIDLKFNASTLKDDSGIDNYIQADEIRINEKFTGHVGYLTNYNYGNYTDFYKVILKSEGVLDLKLTGYSGSGLNLRLYGETGPNKPSIAYHNNITQDSLSKALPAGTYYISVSMYQSSHYSPYLIDVQFTEN